MEKASACKAWRCNPGNSGKAQMHFVAPRMLRLQMRMRHVGAAIAVDALHVSPSWSLRHVCCGRGCGTSGCGCSCGCRHCTTCVTVVTFVLHVVLRSPFSRCVGCRQCLRCVRCGVAAVVVMLRVVYAAVRGMAMCHVWLQEGGEMQRRVTCGCKRGGDGAARRDAATWHAWQGGAWQRGACS